MLSRTRKGTPGGKQFTYLFESEFMGFFFWRWSGFTTEQYLWKKGRYVNSIDGFCVKISIYKWQKLMEAIMYPWYIR